MVLSISANTPELILPCCPTDKPQIRSELGSKVIRCILYCSVLELISVLVYVFAKEGANMLLVLILALMPGLMMPDLQSCVTS